MQKDFINDERRIELINRKIKIIESAPIKAIKKDGEVLEIIPCLTDLEVEEIVHIDTMLKQIEYEYQKLSKQQHY